MHELTILNYEGTLVADSRDVAEIIDKRHADLLRDIENYTETIAASENAKLRSLDFFIPSTYTVPGQSREYPHFLLTKKGCDMVANKMTGKKGILFSAAYVTRFAEMENALRNSGTMAQLEAMRQMTEALIEQGRRLNELSATVDTLKSAPAQPTLAHGYGRQSKRQYIESVDTPEMFDDAMLYLTGLPADYTKGVWPHQNGADLYEDVMVHSLMEIRHPLSGVLLDRNNIPLVADLMAGKTAHTLTKKSILGRRGWRIVLSAPAEQPVSTPVESQQDDGVYKVRAALEAKPGPLGKVLKALGYDVSPHKVARLLLEKGVYQKRDCAIARSLYKPGSDRAIQYFFTSRALPYIITAADRVKEQEGMLW